MTSARRARESLKRWLVRRMAMWSPIGEGDMTGPTTSASTAPASTETSCSGSPTRTSRASGRTASTNRAMSESETIDASSITTTSCGKRWPRWWRNFPGRSGLVPSKRWMVVPATVRSPALTGSGVSRRSASSRTASSIRAAALPVGAASATSGGLVPWLQACSPSRASSRATVVVLPVPGPPAITQSLRVAAAAAAARWSAEPVPGKRRSRSSGDGDSSGSPTTPPSGGSTGDRKAAPIAPVIPASGTSAPPSHAARTRRSSPRASSSRQ